MTLVTSKPAAGCPSTAGSTCTIRVPVVSNSIVTVEGPTCTTSMPYGTLTWLGVRWNSRRPGRAVRRSSTVDMSPGAIRLRAPLEPRTRTSTVSGGLPTISSPAGRFWNSTGTRSTRSTTRSPDTTSHSSPAMQIDSNFRPMFRKGKSAIS